jgi:predicted nucleic acid-binding Zn ribbon protein
MSDDAAHVQPLADVLRRVTTEGPLAKGLREQEILQHWDRFVGALNARHSQALGLRDGVLWVAAESSVWAQELTLLRPHIQAALERELGAGCVREIRFHTGTHPGAPWETR